MNNIVMDIEDNDNHNFDDIHGYADITELMDPVVINGGEPETILNTENLGLFVNNSNLENLDDFLIDNQLPENLQDLECNNNRISELPELPPDLVWLSCNNNELEILPSLEYTSLTHLYCYENNLNSLPELPESIIEVDCTNNLIEGEIGYLPEVIEQFLCSNNQIAGLPELPQSLEVLDCNQNNLKELPELINTSLIRLNCSNNQLTNLPPLPESLRELQCQNNPFTDETIRDVIIEFYNRETTRIYYYFTNIRTLNFYYICKGRLCFPITFFLKVI